MPVTVCVRKRSHVSAWKSFATWKCHSCDTHGPHSVMFVCGLQQGGTCLCISEIHKRPKSFVLEEKICRKDLPSHGSFSSCLCLRASPSGSLGALQLSVTPSDSLLNIPHQEGLFHFNGHELFFVACLLWAACWPRRRKVWSAVWEEPTRWPLPSLWLLGAPAQLHCIPLK